MKQLTRQQLEDCIYQKLDAIPFGFLKAINGIVLKNHHSKNIKDDIMKIIRECSLSQLHYIWGRIQYLGGVTLIDELSIILLTLTTNKE